MVLGLTPLGAIHTAISLVAVVAGAAALIRHRAISPKTIAGAVYAGATFFTCVTGFGIHQRADFGQAHILGVVTLAVLALAALATYTTLLGRHSPYIEAVGYLATYLFNWIPGLTETTTRLPPHSPIFASDQAPGLQTATGVLVVLFLAGAIWQVLRLRRKT